MNGDTDNPADEQVNDNDAAEVSPEATPAVVQDVDNVGDMSVEINVEELVAKVESADSDVTDKERDIRNKLDEIRADKREDLDSTYNFNMDDDL